ncbi:unnamed protein product [Prorocentrum cordatum]|uniref:Uncharacterized protein n=1 Tax=Prorocentrum cordatum TaxID=2364126 RepID=A0ABN9PZL7_9DINO|nr:unnamed protein product [Polarella glacialis]
MGCGAGSLGCSQGSLLSRAPSGSSWPASTGAALQLGPDSMAAEGGPLSPPRQTYGPSPRSPGARGASCACSRRRPAPPTEWAPRRSRRAAPDAGPPARARPLPGPALRRLLDCLQTLHEVSEVIDFASEQRVQAFAYRAELSYAPHSHLAVRVAAVEDAGDVLRDLGTQALRTLLIGRPIHAAPDID